MTPDNATKETLDVTGCAQVWAESVCQVLGQLTGGPFTARSLSVAETAEQSRLAADQGEWSRFQAAKRLTGEQALWVSPSDALKLARILMSEPLDTPGAFTNDHRDAMGEIFRQFAGTASLSLKARLGGEVELTELGTEKPAWTPAARHGFCLTNAQGIQIVLLLNISSELSMALQPPAVNLPAPAPLPGRPGNSPPEPRGPQEIKIDLLMDVELEATLLFGERQMLLRDILELAPGAVVELDRQVQEPVELLVGGKIVARGDVVIVDGNYGLRVTEMATPLERLESLRR